MSAQTLVISSPKRAALAARHTRQSMQPLGLAPRSGAYDGRTVDVAQLDRRLRHFVGLLPQAPRVLRGPISGAPSVR